MSKYDETEPLRGRKHLPAAVFFACVFCGIIIMYYAARLISSQKETEFSGKDYNGIKKVYTIWICMESPTEKSIINHYRLTEHQVFGKYREDRENYDLINIVMVYLAKGPVRNRMLALLQLLFKETKKSAAEKKKLLQSKYDIDVTSDMEEEMRTMCNLSEGIAEEAWAGGMAQGMAQGMEQEKINVIRNLWRAGKDMSIIKIASGWTEEQIMKVLQTEMN